MTGMKTPYGLWMVTLAVILAACSSLPGQSTPTPLPPPVEDFTPVVSATGVVVPARWSTLSMTTSGVIAELPASKDAHIDEGALLLRLQGRENLQAAIAAARFEVAAAQHDLDLLYKDNDLRAAQAQKAVAEAEVAVRDAERYIRNLNSTASTADINAAKANVALAKDKRDKAQDDYAPYEKKPEDNIIRAALLSKLAQAQKEYDAAVRRLNNLQGTANDLDIAEAQADLELAQAQLAAAQRDREIYIQGPDPTDVALAEERVANAKAQLSAAEAALRDLELLAPFSGTVSELFVHQNEWLSLGQPVLLLADLSNLQVETTDLNEIDVARIATGDKATVTFDALPEVAVVGTVTRISSKAAAGSGVNYTVVLELDTIPDALRWGMTAFVDIAVE